MPHPISLLFALSPGQKVSKIVKNVKKNTWSCNFLYGKIHCNFEFIHNSKNLSSKLKFGINNLLFERIQEQFGNEFKVYLKNINNNKIISVTNPMSISIKNAIEVCYNQEKFVEEDNFTNDLMYLIGKLILF